MGMIFSCGTTRQLHKPTQTFASQRRFEQHYHDANTQRVLGNTEKAIELYSLAIVENPNAHEAHYQLAFLYFENKNDWRAKEHIELALKYNPEYNRWYTLLYAKVLTNFASYDKAAFQYEILIENHPDIEAYYPLAIEAYLGDRNPQAAITVLDKLEKEFGVTEYSAYRKASLNVRIGNNKAAVEAIEALIEQHPDKQEYKGLLAETYLSIGKEEKALSILLELDSLNTELGRTYQLLYELYDHRKDEEKALHYLMKTFDASLFEVDRKLNMLSDYYNNIHKQDGYDTIALQLTGLLVLRHPDDYRSYVARGDVQYAIDSLHAARTSYLEAIEHSKQDVNVWNKLLSLDSELEDFDAQLEHSNKALEYFPHTPDFFVSKAMAHKDLGQYGQALDVCEMGLEVAFSSTDIAELAEIQAMCYLEQEKMELAHDRFQFALEALPSDMSLLNNYAYFLAEYNVDLVKAEQLIDGALNVYPENPNFLDTKAWILYKRNNLSEAESYLIKALKYAPDDHLIMEHLIEVYLAAGKTEKANEIQRKLDDHE